MPLWLSTLLSAFSNLQDTAAGCIHCWAQEAAVVRKGPLKKAPRVLSLFCNTDHFQKMCPCPVFWTEFQRVQGLLMAGSHTACGPRVRKPCPALTPLFYKVEHRTSKDQDQNATPQWRRAQIPNLCFIHSFTHSFYKY